MKNAIDKWGLVAIAAWLVSVVSAVNAQDYEDSSGLMDMALTDLLDIALSSRPLLGLHHAHPKGEWMVALNNRHMDMKPMRNGSRDIPLSEVFAQGFRVSPTQMSTDMRMLDVMYGVTNKFTVMAMLPHLRRTMDHQTRMGGQFTTRASGIGDASLSGIYALYESGPHALHASTGIFFPTGSIDERDATPMGPSQILPYPMQIGSGSVAGQLGVTYINSGREWSYGAHFSHKVFVDTNDAGYRHGDESGVDIWLLRQWNDWLTTSFRAHIQNRENIHGTDARLNAAIVPTADPDLRASRRLDLSLGASVRLPFEWSQNIRLVAEYARPVSQQVDGPQLAIQQRWGAGLQWLF